MFAVANVLSIARTTYLMPAFEVLGTLQISLVRMIGDITRFLVLFTLVRRYTVVFRSNFCRATLCVSAVFSAARCQSVCLSVCHVGALYPDG